MSSLAIGLLTNIRQCRKNIGHDAGGTFARKFAILLTHLMVLLAARVIRFCRGWVFVRNMELKILLLKCNPGKLFLESNTTHLISLTIVASSSFNELLLVLNPLPTVVKRMLWQKE